MKAPNIKPPPWAFREQGAGRVKETSVPFLQPRLAPIVFETLDGSDILRQGADKESLSSLNGALCRFLSFNSAEKEELYEECKRGQR